MNNTENNRESTKVDIEKALKLPHLVKTGQFQFRYRNVVGEKKNLIMTIWF